jgi:hypothetical protein
MDIFNATDLTDQVKVEDYVGEGKQFPSVEVLLKSKLDSNKFVKQLEAETKAEREARLEAELLVEATRKLHSQNANGSENRQTGAEPSQTPSGQQTALTVEDLDKILDQKEARKRQEANLKTVTDSLNRVHGTPEKARAFLTSKATELGMEMETLAGLAQNSPHAFLKLVGVDNTAAAPSILPTDKKVMTPNTRKADPNNPQTLEDIAELRRTNFNKYSSPEVQQLMFKLREAEIRKRPN